MTRTSRHAGLAAEAVGWVVRYLPWATVALVAILLPPLAMTLAVNLKLVNWVGSGHPELGDPSVLLMMLRLGLAMAAIPGLSRRRKTSWRLLTGAAMAAATQAAWMFLVYARLNDPIAAITDPAWIALAAGVVMSGCVLFAVRGSYR